MTQTKIFERRRTICVLLFVVMGIVQGKGQENCSLNLITGPDGVPDDHLSAFSVLNNESRYSPRHARLNIYGEWIADSTHSYIEVRFDNTKRVLAVQTQGRATWTHWVTSYAVSFSLDNQIWKFLKDKSSERIFQENSDRNTVVTNVLPEAVIAKLFRIHPRVCEGCCTLRFELIGCDDIAGRGRKMNFWDLTGNTLSLNKFFHEGNLKHFVGFEIATPEITTYPK